MLTIERLKEVFHYDQETGEFSRVDGSSRKIGRVHEKGNIQTSIDGANYSLGRLAWLYVHGVLPSIGQTILRRGYNRRGVSFDR